MLFPSLENNETDSEYFIRVNRWRAKNNIPDEVFVKIKPLPMQTQETKKETQEENSNDDAQDSKTETGTQESIKEDEQPEEKNNNDETKQTENKESKPYSKVSRDFYKPQYIDFNSPIFVSLFSKMTVNLKNFNVVIEERYPSKDQLPKFDNESYATEQIFQINFPVAKTKTAKESLGEFIYAGEDKT